MALVLGSYDHGFVVSDARFSMVAVLVVIA